MQHSMKRFDEAIGNTIGHSVMHALRQTGAGPQRPMLLLKAAQERWLKNMPEDEDAAVLRAAHADLIVHGHFCFTEYLSGGA